jgi:2-oxoglutarate ferredoxin oxidoreductase subunit alpha
VAELPEIRNHLVKEARDGWSPYEREEATLARSWAVPGTPGLEHRVGGLEKDAHTGNVSYVPENHEYMTKIRAEKIKRVQKYIPDLVPEFADSGDLLVIGWGGTYGALHTAVKQLNGEGHTNIGFAHFNYINPLPPNTGEVLKRFKTLIVCELNSGQFAKILKINFNGLNLLQYNKVQGLPFGNDELIQKFKNYLA